MRGIRGIVGRVMACLAAFAALCPAVALAVPAPAGALIESQAVVSYFNTELGIYESVSTNVVVTRVNSVKAIEVVSDQTVFMAPASVGQFAFFIRNTGNAPLSPSATLEQVAGHHANLVDIRAVIDQNRNGTADPGEWELTPDMAIELPVGGELPVIVQFATPASSHDGQLAALRLSAKDGSVADAATGTVIMSSTGLVLEKSATENEVQAGGRLRYGLRLRNNGANAVAAYAQLDGSSILIDGAAASGILVRDARPLNTRVVNAESAAGFVGLYHVAGQPTHTYVTTLPQDPSAVDAVAFFRAGDYPGGFSANLAFEVAVAGNAQEGFILNEASTWQQSGEDLVEVRSNLVRTPVEGGEAALTYAAPDSRPISTAALNSNVRLHLSAAACNTTPGADSVRIRIATDPEADLETAVATETGPNTGLFTTALIPIQRVLPVVQGDSVVSGDRNTKVSASATCGGQTVSAILTVNPGGFVFHSASNVAIPGATVILYDASGAEIERIVSDADGFYVVSAAQNAGAYRIEVLPPEGFSFPSERKVFPALGRNVDAEASYGAAFTTTGAFSGIDIPLDPDASSVLRLEKSVDEANPAPGDILVYSLTLTNTTGIGLVSAAIRDGLPKGISYLEGTARLDGKPVEVSGFPGRNLTFDLGFVGPDDTVALTYMAAVDPTAQGRLANVALASGNLAGRGEVVSNEARALVRIQRDGGVFSDEGVVLGKVYADLNGNGQQDRYLAAGRNAADGALERVEPGVPGVKLQFSNGASVVTDIDGKYSLPGLPPGSHVIAVSTPTLPATVKLRSTTARDALSPQSRYLRLLPGQVVSEYFAVSPREGVSRKEVLAELESRRQAYAENIAASKTVSVPERLNPGGEEWVDYFGRLSSFRESLHLVAQAIFDATPHPAGRAACTGEIEEFRTARRPIDAGIDLDPFRRLIGSLQQCPQVREIGEIRLDLALQSETRNGGRPPIGAEHGRGYGPRDIPVAGDETHEAHAAADRQLGIDDPARQQLGAEAFVAGRQALVIEQRSLDAEARIDLPVGRHVHLGTTGRERRALGETFVRAGGVHAHGDPFLLDLVTEAGCPARLAVLIDRLSQFDLGLPIGAEIGRNIAAADGAPVVEGTAGFRTHFAIADGDPVVHPVAHLAGIDPIGVSIPLDLVGDADEIGIAVIVEGRDRRIEDDRIAEIIEPIVVEALQQHGVDHARRLAPVAGDDLDPLRPFRIARQIQVVGTGQPFGAKLAYDLVLVGAAGKEIDGDRTGLHMRLSAGQQAVLGPELELARLRRDVYIAVKDVVEAFLDLDVEPGAGLRVIAALRRVAINRIVALRIDVTEQPLLGVEVAVVTQRQENVALDLALEIELPADAGRNAVETFQPRCRLDAAGQAHHPLDDAGNDPLAVVGKKLHLGLVAAEAVAHRDLVGAGERRRIIVDEGLALVDEDLDTGFGRPYVLGPPPAPAGGLERDVHRGMGGNAVGVDEPDQHRDGRGRIGEGRGRSHEFDPRRTPGRQNGDFIALADIAERVGKSGLEPVAAAFEADRDIFGRLNAP